MTLAGSGGGACQRGPPRMMSSPPPRMALRRLGNLAATRRHHRVSHLFTRIKAEDGQCKVKRTQTERGRRETWRERSVCRRIAGATSFVPATEKGALLTAVSAPPHPTVGPPAHLWDSQLGRVPKGRGVRSRYGGTFATRLERVVCGFFGWGETLGPSTRIHGPDQSALTPSRTN